MWIRNGSRHVLTDLVIYADGVVDGHGLMTLEEFAVKARAGAILPEPPDATRRLSVEDFVAGVRDDVDWLNRRPASEARCMDAAEVFAREPTEGNRAMLRAAYEEVPGRGDLYVFTDEGSYNRDNIRILVAGPGNEAEILSGTVIVNEELHSEAMRSLIGNRAKDRVPRDPAPDSLGERAQSSVVIRVFHVVDDVIHSTASAKPPHIAVLRNEYPAPIEVAGRVCLVPQAYLALSLADRGLGAELLDSDDPDLATAARESPRRADWALTRTAVMAELLRKKFDAHPDIAAVLMATGDTRLVYEDIYRYWSQERHRGRNWMGRLLEQIRSERAAAATLLEL